MFDLKRILVPVDFSEESEFALEWAVKLGAQEKTATIFLVHVLPYVLDPTYLMNWTDDLVGFRWDQAKKDLVEWTKKVPRSIPCFPILCKGGIGEQIQRVCDEKKVDLVIMTSRERRGLARIIHPNASEATVRLVSCPVLVLHRKQKIAEPAMKIA
jgi:nucleotide-binding universal stress UspA family protein